MNSTTPAQTIIAALAGYPSDADVAVPLSTPALRGLIDWDATSDVDGPVITTNGRRIERDGDGWRIDLDAATPPIFWLGMADGDGWTLDGRTVTTEEAQAAYEASGEAYMVTNDGEAGHLGTSPVEFMAEMESERQDA